MDFMRITIEYEPSSGLLYVNFHNFGNSAYYLDRNLTFINGKCRADCLKVSYGSDRVKRIKKFKVTASNFPNDYVEINPGRSYKTSVALSKNYHFPKSGILLVQYDGMNFNPITNELHHLISDTIPVGVGDNGH